MGSPAETIRNADALKGDRSAQIERAAAIARTLALQREQAEAFDSGDMEKVQAASDTLDEVVTPDLDGQIV